MRHAESQKHSSSGNKNPTRNTGTLFLCNVSKPEREENLKPEVIREKLDQDFISPVTKQVTKLNENRLSIAGDCSLLTGAQYFCFYHE
jgi:hypothetical protein